MYVTTVQGQAQVLDFVIVTPARPEVTPNDLLDSCVRNAIKGTTVFSTVPGALWSVLGELSEIHRVHEIPTY